LWNGNDATRALAESIDEMGVRDWLGLRAAIAVELGQYAGKAKQGPVFVKREPDRVLLPGVRIGLRSVVGEAVCAGTRQRVSGKPLRPGLPFWRGAEQLLLALKDRRRWQSQRNRAISWERKISGTHRIF
jgi:hypothetical protein